MAHSDTPGPQAAFAFGSADTNYACSIVTAAGTGYVLFRDRTKGKATFWSLSVESGRAADKATKLSLAPPADAKHEALDATKPFYMGFRDIPDNPTVYVHEEESPDDDDEAPSVQFADMYNQKLQRFEDDCFQYCTAFFAQDTRVAVCDAAYRYFAGDGLRVLTEFHNPDEQMDCLVRSIALVGGRRAVPVALLHPLPGREGRDPVRIQWWSGGVPVWYENASTWPEGLVCYDDVIVWHGRDRIGWIDTAAAAATPAEPVTHTCPTLAAAGPTVALARSGKSFRAGHIWYATASGAVYHVDAAAGTSHKVLDVAPAEITRMWADDFFLYVLTSSRGGKAWRIADVQ